MRGNRNHVRKTIRMKKCGMFYKADIERETLRRRIIYKVIDFVITAAEKAGHTGIKSAIWSTAKMFYRLNPNMRHMEFDDFLSLSCVHLLMNIRRFKDTGLMIHDARRQISNSLVKGIGDHRRKSKELEHFVAGSYNSQAFETVPEYFTFENEEFSIFGTIEAENTCPEKMYELKEAYNELVRRWKNTHTKAERDKIETQMRYIAGD